MVSDFEPLEIGRAAALFNGVTLGVCIGSPAITLNGKIAPYRDCADAAVALWADETDTALSVTLLLPNCGRVADMLFDGGVCAALPPGTDRLEECGVLVLAPVGGGCGLRFPRALPGPSWSYRWNGGSPHSVELEFRAFPDAQRLLAAREEYPSDAAGLPEPLQLPWSALERELAAAFEVECPVSDIGGWLAGWFPEWTGAVVTIVSERSSLDCRGRELTAEVTLRQPDHQRLSALIAGVCSALPWRNRHGFYLVEPVECRGAAPEGGAFQAVIALRLLAPC